MSQQLRVVNRHGQVSIGKKFAGKMVAIEQVSDSTLTINCGAFVMDSPAWFEPIRTDIAAGLEWAKNTPPLNNFEELAREIEKNAR